MITAITTCMGRREHLEVTLPFMLAAFDKVIVVDWSCPQASGEWAASEGASVAYKYGERYFHRSKARNHGAKLVTSEYIAFVDADTLCMPELQVELKSIRQTNMLLASRTHSGADIPNLFGFVACSTDAFWNAGGYDESYEGWGHEDSQLRGALLLESKLTPLRVSGMALGAIAHDNALRDANHKDTIHATSTANFKKLYSYFDKFGIKDWMSDPRTDSITFKNDPRLGL